MEAKIRHYSVVVSKGEIAFVAYCPELGVTSQGRTESSALKNLKEAVELYLEDSDVQQNLQKLHTTVPKILTISVKA